MRLYTRSRNRKITREAMPARLGEIDGIVHSSPILLTDQAKTNYPIFDSKKVLTLIKQDKFLQFMYKNAGADESALRQIFNLFILENNEYLNQYKFSQSKYDKLSDNLKHGDCFSKAGKYTLDNGLSNSNLKLVHAIICPVVGPVSGVEFGHAWVEDGDQVINTSNKNETFEKSSYYVMAGLINFIMHDEQDFNKSIKEENIIRYSAQEARKLMIESGHYGPWDSRLEGYTVN